MSDVASFPPRNDNLAMARTPWQRRIERAQVLAERHSYAVEILGFFREVADFQEALFKKFQAASRDRENVSLRPTPGLPALPEWIENFPSFMSLVERVGPERLAGIGREMRMEGDESWSRRLENCWSRPELSPSEPQDLLCLAFLQPYAEFVRSRMSLDSRGYTYPLCPFCNRKPGLAILKQQGDGALRELMCSFCLAEWEFRRIVCPACGEEDHQKLPVYTAEEFAYMRVECCDTCKSYIKAVDLTKEGWAEPLVDEIASIPLDLWAQSQGYSKIRLNMMGM